HCEKNFLSPLRMREWREVHRQLLLQCQELKWRLNETPADYEAVHLALLTGFVDQVARRLDDGSWLGTRTRKFNMFRGSALHRKGCRWLVSAELVETQRVYARMNARVEPEWIEKVARHLVRHDYFEPFFDAKRGQVQGYEKVSLQGLVLVEKRRVNYARVDPAASRELFIREGLCQMHARTRAPFHAHNRKLVEGIQDLEERSRRRALLVDEQQLYDWYEQRLPAEVVDVPSLERWYRAAGKTVQQGLFMQEADLMQQPADVVEQGAFPEQLQVGGLELDLDYVFDPGKE